MQSFADQLIEGIRKKRSPVIVGLDPRIDAMPKFARLDSVRASIVRFHEVVLDAIAPHVPAVKPQIAFYEQYGIEGLHAFVDTIAAAKRRGLLVVGDVKRNDIASTAEAYAQAFLGANAPFPCDCVTVSPFLGRDSLAPFVTLCRTLGRGLFVLVKTSNPGSADFQDQRLASGVPLYTHLANVVAELASDGAAYSSIGAVVGATHPTQAKELRALMPRSIFLVPGYGAQGGTAADAAACFNADGLGAIVNASRGITYSFSSPDLSEAAFAAEVTAATIAMRDALNAAVGA